MVHFNPQIELRFYAVGSEPTRLSESTYITQKTKFERSKYNVSTFGSYELLQVKQECLYDKLYIWIIVPNLEFQKSVVFRITNDRWSTYQDLIGCYVNSFTDLTNGGEFDTFVCTMDIPNSFQQFEYCIRYQYGNQELWENNQGKNYSMDIWKKEVLKVKKTRQCINEMDLRRVLFQFLF